MTLSPIAGEGNPVKAYIEIEGGAKLPCHFNPTEITVSKQVRWSPANQAVGTDAPSLTFDKGSSATYRISELTFDTTGEASAGSGSPVLSSAGDGASVAEYTTKLLNCLKVDPAKSDSGGTRQSGRPPWVRFVWGAEIKSFKAVIEDLSIRYTMFSPAGVPLRAKVGLTLKQFEPEDEWWKQNPTSGTPNPHKLHTVQPGETLDRIAAAELGAADKWRIIAEANRITNPLALKPGTVLTIPDRSEIDDV
jgi:hypothetical protein